MEVTDHQQLYPSERLTKITVAPEHFIDGVKQVCPDHADLVDDQKIEAFDQLDLLPAKPSLPGPFMNGSGRYGAKWKLEKGMNGNPFGLYGCNPCWRNYGYPLQDLSFYPVKESGFGPYRLSQSEIYAYGSG